MALPALKKSLEPWITSYDQALRRAMQSRAFDGDAEADDALMLLQVASGQSFEIIWAYFETYQSSRGHETKDLATYLGSHPSRVWASEMRRILILRLPCYMTGISHANSLLFQADPENYKTTKRLDGRCIPAEGLAAFKLESGEGPPAREDFAALLIFANAVIAKNRDSRARKREKYNVSIFAELSKKLSDSCARLAENDRPTWRRNLYAVIDSPIFELECIKDRFRANDMERWPAVTLGNWMPSSPGQTVPQLTREPVLRALPPSIESVDHFFVEDNPDTGGGFTAPPETARAERAEKPKEKKWGPACRSLLPVLEPLAQAYAESLRHALEMHRSGNFSARDIAVEQMREQAEKSFESIKSKIDELAKLGCDKLGGFARYLFQHDSAVWAAEVRRLLIRNLPEGSKACGWFLCDPDTPDASRRSKKHFPAAASIKASSVGVNGKIVEIEDFAPVLIYSSAVYAGGSSASDDSVLQALFQKLNSSFDAQRMEVREVWLSNFRTALGSPLFGLASLEAVFHNNGVEFPWPNAQPPKIDSGQKKQPGKRGASTTKAPAGFNRPGLKTAGQTALANANAGSNTNAAFNATASLNEGGAVDQGAGQKRRREDAAGQSHAGQTSKRSRSNTNVDIPLPSYVHSEVQEPSLTVVSGFESPAPQASGGRDESQQAQPHSAPDAHFYTETTLVRTTPTTPVPIDMTPASPFGSVDWTQFEAEDDFK